MKTFATRDINVASEELGGFYGNSARFDYRGRRNDFAMRFQAASLGNVSIAECALSGWRMVRASGDVVLITFPTTGVFHYRCGLRSFDADSPRRAWIGRPNEIIDLGVDRARGLALYIAVAELVERAERLTGRDCNASILANLEEQVDLKSPTGAALLRTVKQALAEIRALNAAGLGALAAAGYEELLLDLSAGCVIPQVKQAFERPSRECGPRSVRRVRDYIESHATEPIELSRLAREAGVSMRALQENFRRCFGLSPRGYIMERRLAIARQRLANPDREESVTRVAFESGFTDLNHFSMRYREAFGELPSHTLKTARRGTA